MSDRVTMETLRKKPVHKRKEWLNSLSEAQLEATYKDWEFMARSEQLAPNGDWANWLYLAGRGAGKTRTGGEWVREQVRNGFMRGGLIAPTAGDVRDVMVEGESGILAVSCQRERAVVDGLARRTVKSKDFLLWGSACRRI